MGHSNGQRARSATIWHEGAVISVAWSPNGYFIVSGSEDCTVRTWDSSGNLLNTVQIFSATGFASAVLTVAFCPDAVTIVSDTNDRTVRFWDVKTREPVGKPISCDYPVGAVAFSPNREHMVALQKDASIHLWTAADATFNARGLFDKSRDDVFSSLSFVRGAQHVITGTTGGYVHVWDAQSGMRLSVCRASNDAVSFVQIVPRSNNIIAISNGVVSIILYHFELFGMPYDA